MWRVFETVQTVLVERESRMRVPAVCRVAVPANVLTTPANVVAQNIVIGKASDESTPSGPLSVIGHRIVRCAPFVQENVARETLDDIVGTVTFVIEARFGKFFRTRETLPVGETVQTSGLGPVRFCHS